MFLTIFTPCYNRAECLERLYRSLQKQTCKDFEWIAIDDGSKDNTYAVLQVYANEKNQFAIHVLSIENGGKHRAVNRATKLAKGKYFLILDSDDFLIEDAVLKIKSWCQEIEKLPDFNEFAGVAGLKMFQNQTVVGGSGHGEVYIDATNLERDRFKLQGDKAEIYKTETLRRFPFKEFEGEKYLSERTAWDVIAENKYKIRWYMEAIYVCEYRNDGLTKNARSLRISSFNGYTYAIKEMIRLQPLSRKTIAGIGEYVLTAEEKGLSIKEVSQQLKINTVILSFLKIVKASYNFLKKDRKERNG